MPASVWQFATHLPAYRRSLKTLESVLVDTRPDVLFNFLEPLVGFHAPACRVPVLAVGHQYMLRHPAYPRLAGHRLPQWGLRRFVSVTGRATLRYALSFYEAAVPGDDSILVAPPLLRDEVLQLSPVPGGGHCLVYLLNAGYLGELERWAARRPGATIHVFCERPAAPQVEERPNGVIVHRLDGRRFIELMAGARAVVCSAGFESLSEAAWLGKPALAVPVEGHIEQMLNAVDMERAGLGVAGSRFDLDLLERFQPGPAQERFRAWVRRSDAHLDEALGRLLGCAPARAVGSDRVMGRQAVAGTVPLAGAGGRWS